MKLILTLIILYFLFRFLVRLFFSIKIVHIHRDAQKNWQTPLDPRNEKDITDRGRVLDE